jgi:hypothetical protein
MISISALSVLNRQPRIYSVEQNLPQVNARREENLSEKKTAG